VPFLDGPFALEFTRLNADRLRIAGKQATQAGEREVVIVEARQDNFIRACFPQLRQCSVSLMHADGTPCRLFWHCGRGSRT